jgi:hypothetical protein
MPKEIKIQSDSGALWQTANEIAKQLDELEKQISQGDEVARQLEIENTDVNELRKAIAYLRMYQDRENSGQYFFNYLETLVKHGNQIGHSKRTRDYYESLYSVCKNYLDRHKNDVSAMLMILGWAARLMQYYSRAVPPEEIKPPEFLSERETELKAINKANTFTVGQELEATITSIKGKKVTYEILGSIRLTQKEPKYADNMTEKKRIMVEIIQLRDDGLPKKLKPIF